MPILNWIGKDKVINHHQDVAFKVLEHSYGFDNGKQSPTPVNSGNKIIHGDNLEALKALLPEYEGKVKCIYIDPPYNTGNENWVYNDNVNHPKIKKWLGQIVGKESEDLTRHDKWLCMMYPRLKLLHKLLADDGAIFISIDDNEQTNLKLICDEIFGSSNFVTQFIWEKKKKPAFLGKQLGSITEYITCYAKNRFLLSEFSIHSNKTTENKKYPINNAGNSLATIQFPANSVSFGIQDCVLEPQDMSEGNIKTKLLDTLKIKNGTNANSFQLEGEWRYSQKTLDEIIFNNDLITISKVPFRPNHIKQGGEAKKIHNYLSSKTYNVQTNEDASETLTRIFKDKVFDFSKPHNLIELCVEISTNKDSIILDSFAGSGTTAHAVLNLNKQDGGNRKVILVEMENYAETITAERVKRVIKGYADVEGTGGCFDFYELGQPLFLEDGNLNETVGVEKIRQYVYYTETQSHLTESKYKDNPHFLDKHNDTCYYLNYDTNGITTLDHDFLATLKTRAEQYVIYADNCLLTKAYMTKHHITFKKIPRDVTRF